MHDPVIYHMLRAYPAATVVSAPSFTPMTKLCCADTDSARYLVHDDFAAACSHHDGADTFITVLEIHARTVMEFSIECTHHDMHGWYLEQGQVTAHRTGDQLVLHTGQYTLLYASPGEYSVRIEAGQTIVKLWSTSNRSLLRDRDKKVLRPLDTLLSQWADKRPRCHHTRILPFSGDCHKTWERLAALPHLRPLTMDNRLRETITALIYCCIDKLTESRKESNRSLELVHQVRAKAIKLIREGVVPKVLELAADHGVSDSYLRRIHRKYYHGSPQDFIMGLRLRKARELIIGNRDSKHYTYTQIAYMVGFTCVQDLNKQYKKLYTYLPHETNDLLFEKK